MMRSSLLTAVGLSILLGGCGEEPNTTRYGANPGLPEQQRGLLPSMKIADPVGWGDMRPTVPQGYAITAIATGLKVPRQTLVLPNGDILVAEGKGGGDHQSCSRPFAPM